MVLGIGIHQAILCLNWICSFRLQKLLKVLFVMFTGYRRDWRLFCNNFCLMEYCHLRNRSAPNLLQFHNHIKSVLFQCAFSLSGAYFGFDFLFPFLWLRFGLEINLDVLLVIILLFEVFVFCPESWGLGYIISAVNRYFALWMRREKENLNTQLLGSVV